MRAVHHLPQVFELQMPAKVPGLKERLYQQPGIWPLLGDACACVAAPDLGALSVLLQAVLLLTKR